MRPLAYRGISFSIFFAVMANGTSPGKIYYDGLSDKFKARFGVLFKKLGDSGKIFNKEQFKIIEGTRFFEFKAHYHRMPCHFLPDRVVLVTHGLEKKKPKLDQEDIDRAQRIYDEDQEVSRKMEEMRNKKEKSNVQ